MQVSPYPVTEFGARFSAKRGGKGRRLRKKKQGRTEKGRLMGKTKDRKGKGKEKTEGEGIAPPHEILYPPLFRSHKFRDPTVDRQ